MSSGVIGPRSRSRSSAHSPAGARLACPGDMGYLRSMLSLSIDRPTGLRNLATLGLLVFAVVAGYASVQPGMKYPAGVALLCLMVLFRRWQEHYVLALAVLLFFMSGAAPGSFQEKGETYRWHGLFLLLGVGGLRTIYQERWDLYYRPLYIGIYLWLFYLLWSTLWSWDLKYSFPRALAIILVLTAAFFTVGRYVRDGMEPLGKLLGALAVMMLPWLAVQFQGWGNVTLDGRFEGIMGHVNALGGITVLAIPLGLYLALDGPVPAWQRWVGGVVMMMAVVLLVLCASRSAIVGAGVACFLYLLIRNPIRMLAFVALLTLVVLLLIGYHVDIIDTFHLERLVRPQTLETGTNRTVAWSIALYYHQLQPVWGWGYFSGRFLIVETAFLSTGLLMSFGHFHNSYLEILVDLGWLGAIPFVGFFLWLFWKAARRLSWARGDRRYRHAVLGMGAVTLAGLIHAGFESWLLQPGNLTTLLFWSLAVCWIRLVVDAEPFRSTSQVAPAAA